jgi:hypothetical protein
MAKTKAELQSDIARKKAMVQQASVVNATMDAEEKKAAKETVKKLEAEIKRDQAELDLLMAPEIERKKKKKIEEQKAAGTYVPENVPVGLPDDILQEFKNNGITLDEGTFAVNGIGNTMLVYGGEKTTGKYAGGTLVQNKVADVKYTNKVVQSFIDDESIRSKVKAAMAAVGRTDINDITAYDEWKNVVAKAAEVYAGGRGLKVTPMDVLNMAVAGSRKANLPTQDITLQDPNVLKEIIKNNYRSTIGRLPNPEEEAARLNELNAIINKGTVTTTKTIGGKKVSTQTAGFTQATAEALITKKAKETAPEDYKLQQGLNFSDWLTKQMGSGI